MELTKTQQKILPKTRVKCFDHLLFRNDKDTPLSVTVKPGIVVRRYGDIDRQHGPYPDLCDIQFDHRSNVSKGHFTYCVEPIERGE